MTPETHNMKCPKCQRSRLYLSGARDQWIVTCLDDSCDFELSLIGYDLGTMSHLIDALHERAQDADMELFNSFLPLRRRANFYIDGE